MNTEDKVVENEEVKTEEETVLETEKKESKKEVKNKLKDLNVKLEAEVASLKDELLRNRAEVENFKKRMREENIKDRKYASVNLIGDLITPIEYLTKACEMETEDASLKNFLIGFKMISNQITEVLKNDGLTEIESLNKPFDPAIHHAVETVYIEGVEPNMVVFELSKGFMYKDRIVKPAMVKVSKEKELENNENKENQGE